MRMSLVEVGDSPANPLDMLEDVLTANEWPFDRAAEDQLVVETAGRWCDFRMFFVWRCDLNALYFSCAFDTKVPPEKRNDINDLLALANENLWFGHFEICSGDSSPMFRHTLLTRGMRGLAVEQLGTHLRECDVLSGFDVRGPTHHGEVLRAQIHRGEPQAVGIRMRLEPLHQAHIHVGPARARAGLIARFDPGHGQPVRKLVRR